MLEALRDAAGAYLNATMLFPDICNVPHLSVMHAQSFDKYSLLGL